MELCFYDIGGHTDAAKIELLGEMDPRTWDSIEQRLWAHFEKSGKKIFLYDFHKLTFLNSTGIRFFIRIIRTAEQNQKKVAFVDPHPNIAEIFQLLGIDKIVKIFPDVEKAMESITNYE